MTAVDYVFVCTAAALFGCFWSWFWYQLGYTDGLRSKRR